jgi:hypothetical protein
MFENPCLRFATVALVVAVPMTLRAAEPVRYILDTDIASDCDDAGAVAMVNCLLDNGEVNVLAMMVSTGGQYGAPALSAINTWYGHPGIPIGTLKNPTFWVGGSPERPAGAFNYESYNRVLAERYPVQFQRGDDAPDARLLYRKILAAQPDHSVVINTIGPLSNVCVLMQTEADEHSTLNGMDLIRAKVKMLVVCGGRQPSGTSSNFSKENAEIYTKPMIEQWPAPTVFVGNEVGHVIDTGWSRNAQATADSPARLAYSLFHRKDASKIKHHSADQAGVLFAVRGTSGVYELVEKGHQACDDEGHTTWVSEPAPGKQHAYLRKLPGMDAKIAEMIEALMTQLPK